MSTGRIDCNVPECPNKYHYSTTNMKEIHKQLGIGEENTKVQNNSIQDVSNSFVSDKQQNTVYKLEDTSESMKEFFRDNPTSSTYRTSIHRYPLPTYEIEEEFEENGDKNYIENIVSKDKIMDTFSNLGGIEVSDEHDNIYSSEEMLKDFSENIEDFNYNDYDYNEKISENDPDGFIGVKNVRSDYKEPNYSYSLAETKIKIESFLMENRGKQLAQVSVLTTHVEDSYTDFDEYLPVDNSVSTVRTASTTGIIVKTQEGEVTYIPLDNKNKKDGIDKLSSFINDFQNDKKKESVRKENSSHPEETLSYPKEKIDHFQEDKAVNHQNEEVIHPRRERQESSVNTSTHNFAKDNKSQNGILNNIKKFFRR